MAFLAVFLILLGMGLFTSAAKNVNPLAILKGVTTEKKTLTQSISEAGNWYNGTEGSASGARGGAVLGSGAAVSNAHNGKLTNAELSRISFSPGYRLAPAAARALESMNSAYRKKFGKNLVINSAYRNLAQQAALVAAGKTSATPGTSEHGNGIAVDLGGMGWGTASRKWMESNAATFGFISPSWAQRNQLNEPWHWEFHG